MSTIVVPDVGEVPLLRKMLKDALSVDETYTLHLFVNDETPDDDTVIGDLTEASFTGYATKVLTRAGWGAPGTAGGITSSVYAQQQFDNTGGPTETVYGYYVTATDGGELLWLERLDDPRVVASGDNAKITPRFELA